MGFLPFTLQTFDGSRRNDVGDFRRLSAATAAASRAVENPRTTLAVVRDADGVLVFATDGEQTWDGEVMPMA